MGSTPSFKKVCSSLEIHRERTMRIPLDRIISFGSGVPTLLVKFAGNGSPAHPKIVAVEEQLANHPETENRRNLRRTLRAPVFAEHVVVGWENIYSDDGQPVEFSVDACRALLNEIATPNGADMFDRLAQAFEPNNFRDPLPTAASVGKG